MSAILFINFNYPMKSNIKHTRPLAVIMSLYKGDLFPYAKAAIDSIFAQTFANFDLYICIDGNIAEDIDTYIKSLPSDNLFIYKNETNLGLAKSMNRLLAEILPNPQYLYIARMDADDINAPERFEKQVSFLKTNKEIDCVGTWAIEIDANGNEYFKKQMPVSHAECFDFFSKRDCMIHPTVMFRKSYFEKAGLYPEDTYFGEDTMMWAQGFAARCQFSNLPEYLYYFRLNEQFFERRRGIKHAKSIWNLRCKVNKMLHYGLKAYLYAMAYATAKLMPTKVLDMIYKKAR